MTHMKKPIVRIAIYVAFAASAWFGYIAWRASRNLVTLNVRNAPVRDVVRSIERQTWEIIATHKNVEGTVTLKVKDARLEDVLNIIAEQVSCRWSAMYPLYTTGQSLDRFKKSVRGELTAADNGWTNLHTRPFGLRGGMFADNLRAENDRVTVHLHDKDLLIATMALARYAQAQIVPEDGAAGTVSVKVQDGTMSDAVKQLARQTHRKWTQYYALLGGFRPSRRDLTAGGGTNALTGDTTTAIPRPFEEPPPEVVEARRKQFEAQLETMTPEEREKAQAERQRMEQMRAEMANLTPEQRRERMEQMMNSPEGQERRARMEAQMQSRMANSIKNLTPEQRVERDKFFQEMRRNGGFGGRGPGGPPPR